jgi:predicted outer membrane protein
MARVSRYDAMAVMNQTRGHADMSARSKAVWAILAALVIVACGGSGSSTSSGYAATGGSFGAGGLAGSGGAEEALSDAQIIKVVETIHVSRVAEAESAKARASDQKVLDYASALSDAHRDAGAAVSALEKKLSLTPTESKMSLTVAATSSVEVENLAGAASADFDRVYMQAQVTDHGKAQVAVDSLLGMTQNSDIKSSLTTLRAMAKDEHAQATMILSSL